MKGVRIEMGREEVRTASDGSVGLLLSECVQVFYSQRASTYSHRASTYKIIEKNI